MKAEYEADYLSPGIAETGKSIEEVEQRVLELAEEKKHLSPRMLKTELFEYMLDNMRLGSAPDDRFPSFGIWGHKPYDPILNQTLADMRNQIQPPRTALDSRELICFRPDYAHSVPDWQTILDLGFSGLLDRARQAERRFFEKHADSQEKREFFQSVIRACEAVLRCMKRLADFEERSGALPETVAAIRHLTTGRAETFHEALLQIWFYYQFSEYADDLQTRSFGNWDQMLYPYYKHDLGNGVTEETIRLLLRNYMGKVTAMHYYWGHPFYLGGTRPDGSSAINDLTYLILDEYDRMGIYDPKIQIKINLNTPTAFLNKVLDMIRRGHNSIVLIGEPCIRRSMLRAGYTEEEARTAVIKGCYEYTELRSAVETTPVHFILPRAINHVLRENPDAPDFEFLMRKVEEKIDDICRNLFPAVDRMEALMDRINPILLFSAVSDRALEYGVDGYAIAPLHSHTNIWIAGPATSGDSLCAVKKFVFDKKLISLPELLHALDSDWRGFEDLQRKIANDGGKFGNNDPEADAILDRLLKMLTSRINGRKNARGGFYSTALHSTDDFVAQGKKLEATPEGRHKGEEFSKNISPQPGRCRHGVTGQLLSVFKLDTSDFIADFPVDVVLNPSAVRGEDGLDAMRSLVMTYIRNFGHAIHFNVFSVKQLEDAKLHPEKYPELQIRVCGWNVLWNNLCEEEKTAYLAQAYANEAGKTA